MEAHRPEPEESWQDRQFDEQHRQAYEKYVKDLQHFKDSSVGLYVTDKPIGDLLHLFWQYKGKINALEYSMAEKEADEFKEWAKSISWQLS